MFEIGTASGAADLLDKLNTFLTAKGSAFGLSYSGVGNGTFTAYRGGASSVAETFTITASNSTTFGVVGSVSGSIGTATVGTPFANAKLEFTLTAGGTAFQAGDVFTIATAPKWVADRSSAGSEYIWHAPGNDGASTIYCGAKYFNNVSGDYYNWRLGGFTSFDSGLSFESQIGNSRPVLNLWQNSIPYWFVCNGRRVIVAAKVSTVYVSAYLGFIQPYATPGEFPYPLMVGGSAAFNSEPASTSSSWRWSDTSANTTNYMLSRTTNSADNDASLRLRLPDGTYRGFCTQTSPAITNQPKIFPYTRDFLGVRPNLDGSYPLFPIILHDNLSTYGKLEGVNAITGYAISSESEITQGLKKHIAFQNIFRTSVNEYFAVELD